MQANQQIPHANRSYILSGEPALFASQGFTGTPSVRSGFGGFCEASTAFFEIPQPGFPPLGEREGDFLIPNRYSYVLNNPLRYNDPTGYRIRTAPGEDETYINHDALRYIGVGRMGPGTGNHWSDSFNMSMGNFHIFSASTLGLPIGTDTRTVDFGMRNGVPGYFFNYVSVSPQRRIGSPGSKDFRATFEVGYKRRFVPAGGGGVVVDNSWQATKHYLFGDGSPARIGPNTTNSLLNSPQFLKAHRGIINGQSSQSGKFTVDMTKRVFHIGRTNVSYSIAPGGHSVTYKLYDGDGFWDPDFIDEKYLGPSSPYFRPDGPGPNLERLGGTPYYYIPTIITFPF